MTGTDDAVVPAPQPALPPEPSPEPVNDIGPLTTPQASGDKKKDAAKHPLVRAVMEMFPGAIIEEVRDGDAAPEEAEEDFQEGAMNESDGSDSGRDRG